MKKLLVVFVITAMFGLKAEAQVYANFYAGYSMPLAGATFLDPASSVYGEIIYPMYNYERVESIATFDQNFISLGQGLNIKGAIGTEVSETLALEVDFGFLMGDRIEATQTSKVTIVGILYNSEQHFAYQANMFQIVPMLVMNSDIGFANLFLKFGPVVNLGGAKISYFSNINGQTTDQEVKLTGGISLGMSSALGASYDLAENMSLFAELQVMSLSYSPAKAEIVKFEVNGTDNLSNLDVEDKEFIFHRTYEQDLSVNHPNDEPTDLLKVRFPMSNIGLNIGVRMSF